MPEETTDATGPTDPLEVFADFIARVDQGDATSFEALLAAHPGCSDELVALHRDWRQAVELVGDVESYRRATVDPESPTTPAAGGLEADGDLARLLGRVAQREGERRRYEVLDEVARGSMGSVLRVWDGDLRRHLAMKVLLEPDEVGASPPSTRNPRRLTRFLEEALVTGQLDHPGIVPVHEVGLNERGRLYFTMKLVKGRTLHEVFRLSRAGERGWNVPRALGCILKVCEAMAYAHAKGVIHRDLKPSNVMVGRFGEVLVMDWGLARVLGKADTKDIRPLPEHETTVLHLVKERRDALSSGASPLVTMDGDVVGTPAYMPPEQADGRLEDLGPLTDVYAVGAMIYHLLTGEVPYTDGARPRSAHAVLARVLEGPPRPIRDVAPHTPRELVAIGEKAMARSPEDRYAGMEALAEDLRAFLEGRVVAAFEGGPLAELRKWMGRNRVATGLAGSVLALLLGVVALSTWVLSNADEVQAAESARLEARLDRSLEEGYLALGEGQGALALESFEEAARLAPRDVVVLAGQVLANLELERPSAALAALDAGGAPAALRRLELEALRADVRRSGAAEALAEYRRLRGQELRAFRFVAGEMLALLALGDEGEVLRLFEQDPTLLREHPSLAHLRLEALEREPALVSLAKWQRMHLPPASTAEEHELAGLAQLARGEPSAAADQFENAILATHGRPRALYYFQALRAAARAQGSAYSSREGKSASESDRVQRLARSILALWPDSPGAADNVAAAYRDYRRLDPRPLRGEGLERVLATLAAKAGQQPEDADAQAAHARGLMLAGRLDEAARAQERAVELDRRAERLLELALLQGEQGYDERALRTVREALALDPRLVPAWSFLGTCLADGGACAEALAAFETVEVEQGGPDARSRYNRAMMLRRLGRFAEAEESLRESLMLADREGHAANPYPYGARLKELGELRAREAEEESLRAGPLPDDPAELAARAEYFRLKGLDLLAARHYERFIAVAPQQALPSHGWLAGAAAAGASRAASDPTERAAWCRKALAWLDSYYRELVRTHGLGDPDVTTPRLRKLLEGLRLDRQFAPLRDPFPADLPEAERAAARELLGWAEDVRRGLEP